MLTCFRFIYQSWFCLESRIWQAFKQVIKLTPYFHELFLLIDRPFSLPCSVSDLFAMAAHDVQITAVAPSVLGGQFPNSYTCTTACAECIVYEYQNELPVVIVRPSIVLAVWKEPLTASSSIRLGTYIIIFIREKLSIYCFYKRYKGGKFWEAWQ